MNNCDFITCRYSKGSKRTNDNKRKEYVEIVKLVLCKDFAYEREIYNR